MNTRFLKLLLPVLLVLAIVGIGVHAYAGESVGYNFLRTAPTVVPYLYQGLSTSPAAVDSTTWAAPAHPIATIGNPTAACLCEFDTSAATATVRCGLYMTPDGGSTWKFLGESAVSVTATAGASTYTDSAGVFPAGVVATFDTRGASHFDFRLTTISAGQVNAKEWGYGLQSK